MRHFAAILFAAFIFACVSHKSHAALDSSHQGAECLICSAASSPLSEAASVAAVVYAPNVQEVPQIFGIGLSSQIVFAKRAHLSRAPPQAA